VVWINYIFYKFFLLIFSNLTFIKICDNETKMEKSTTENQRNPIIDSLRGMAVLGMISAHGLYFFHNGTNFILNNIQYLLNIIIFPIFVFVSGNAAFYSGINLINRSLREKFVKIFRQCFTIYLGYLLIASTVIILNYESNYGNLAAEFIKAALFIKPPNFSEYLIFFILSPCFQIISMYIYKKPEQSLLLTGLLAITVYLAGVILYPLDTPLNTIKLIFAGGSLSLRFPILFYLPVFLFGIWWAQSNNTSIKNDNNTIKVSIIIWVITFFISIINIIYEIPILSFAVRWPPSIGLLSLGISVSLVLYNFLNQTAVMIIKTRIFKFFEYLGIDAFDLLITHLMILNIYSKISGFQTGNIFLIIFLLLLLLFTSVGVSSINFSNNISIWKLKVHHIKFFHARKVKKRYFAAVAVFFLWLVTNLLLFPTTSLYGESLAQNAFTISRRLPKNTEIFIEKTDNYWVKKQENTKDIIIRIEPETAFDEIIKNGYLYLDLPEGSKIINEKKSDNGQKIFTVSYDKAIPGTYEIKAYIKNTSQIISQKSKNIKISEPFLVAWTFDWEGWDIDDETYLKINEYSEIFNGISFTHFVNPRSFLTTAMNTERIEKLKNFLSVRMSAGDEIALHIHAHYDLVEAAGLTPIKSKHWGLRSFEGYDVPLLSYTSDDFEKIVLKSKSLLIENGFPEPKGFRAGGWYINSKQLAKIKNLGFYYDSSGRNKPVDGAFRHIEWNLSENAQPYFPNENDQNQKADEGFFLEIPNNGLTTYESSVEDLIKKIHSVRQFNNNGNAAVLVFVSHPQFAEREFEKIPLVIKEIGTMLEKYDDGPVTMVTMRDIYNIWTSH